MVLRHPKNNLLLLFLTVIFPELSTAQSSTTENAATIRALRSQAHAAYANAQYEQAYEAASQTCKLQPENIGDQLFLGEVSFAAAKMNECIAAYDQAILIRPSIEPRLWQRGLALYYAGLFDAGVRQFETHQTVNSQDVENAVWHLLCVARISDVDQAREKLIPITGDTRVPMSQIYEMFAGRITPEQVLDRAQETTTRGNSQQQLQLYYAHLYTGLYNEMLGDQSSAIQSLEKAESINPLGKTNFMGQVARVHLSLLEAALLRE